MTTQVITDGTTPPNGAAPPVSPVVPPPAPDAGGDPAWLPARLDRARTAAAADVLRELGITDVAAGKAAIAEAARVRDASKSESERQAEQLAALRTRVAQADESAAALKEYAEAELSKLTQDQREAVVDIAGTDHAKQLKTLVRLRKTWAKDGALPAQSAGSPVPTPPGGTPPTPGAPAGGGTTPPVPPPPAPPPNTVPPAGSAPPGASGGSPTSKLSQWRELEKSNPFAASNFYLRNYSEIERERAASPGR